MLACVAGRLGTGTVHCVVTPCPNRICARLCCHSPGRPARETALREVQPAAPRACRSSPIEAHLLPEALLAQVQQVPSCRHR